MTDKIAYAALHYLALLIFLLASWGYGHYLMRRLVPSVLPSAASDTPFLHAYSAILGTGILICFLQWLAIAGQLRLAAVIGIVAPGVLIGVLQMRALRPFAWPSWGQRWRAASWPLRGAGLIIALLLLPTLIAPLGPPLAWDEVMYHLDRKSTRLNSSHITIS